MKKAFPNREGFCLRQNNISVFAQRVEQALTMLLAADFADHVNNRVPDVEIRLHAVVVKQDDVRVLLGNQMGEAFERTGRVGHDGRELEVSAAGDQTLFDHLVNERYVDVAAGEHTADLFARDVRLVVEHRRERRRARRQPA